MAQMTPLTTSSPSEDKMGLEATFETQNKGQGSHVEAIKDGYRVHLPVFEGPLDLLLHLIRKEQLNIQDIPISQICETYVAHLEMMKQIDVNLAGEFMVMASTLTLIKSMMILPKDETAEEDDPRLPLVAQLIEYEKFKKAADQIDKIHWLNRDIYTRSPEAITNMMPVESLLDAPIDQVDNFQLLVCLKIALDRTQKKPIQIETDHTSIKDKVRLVTELFDTHEVLQFNSLLPENPGIKDVIVSFLAILELAKLKYIEIIQTETYGPIQIRSARSLRELNDGLLDQY